MAPVMYVLAILGCGDARADCRQVRIEPARYASLAACRAATTAALMRSTDLFYPVVVSECRTDTQRSAAAFSTRIAAR